MTLWWDRAAGRLLREAAEAFERLGDSENQALAWLWIGKIHEADGEHREVTEVMTRVLQSVPADHRLALLAHANLVAAFEELGERDRPRALPGDWSQRRLGTALQTTNPCSNDHPPTRKGNSTPARKATSS